MRLFREGEGVLGRKRFLGMSGKNSADPNKLVWKLQPQFLSARYEIERGDVETVEAFACNKSRVFSRWGHLGNI